jgi:hypothetical protein
MNSLSLLTVCGIAVSAMFHFVVSFTYAQAPQNKAMPLIVGKWKLNPEKTGIPNAPIVIQQFVLRQDGFMVGLSVLVEEHGTPTFLETAWKDDGKEYPLYDDSSLAGLLTTGSPTTQTYSEKMIDEYTTEYTNKEFGKVIDTAKRTISKDGKTMTLTHPTGGPPLVFDRQ